MNQQKHSARRARSAWHIQRAVLFALVLRELRTRLEGRWLGALWMIFEPLAQVLLMLAIYDFVRHVNSPFLEFPVFLVTGMLPFFIFRNLVLRGADAPAANRGLFSYRQVKPIDTLLARAIVETGLYSAVYVSTLALLGWLGFQWFPRAPLELAGVSALVVVFGIGLALALTVATHNRPRVRSVVGLLFFPLYLLSGVVFNIHLIPYEWRQWLAWNPVLHLVELSRYYFIENYAPLPEVSITYPAAWTLMTLALGLSLYRVDRYRLIASV